MSIGATTGKEPDHVEDGDLKTLDELRGALKDLHTAKLSLNEKATVQGVMTEIQILRSMFDKMSEQNARLIGMYQTLSNEFEQYRQARVRELTVRVNGGSTTPEDYDGDINRPGNAGN